MQHSQNEAFERAFEQRAPKRHVKGTHRTVGPAETLARARQVAPSMGITRIANVTGLDVVGIPVTMVVRPNARSLSVSQGKSLDLDAAKASGIMESIELHHAENVERPLRFCTAEELRREHSVADLAALSRPSNSIFHDDLPMLWIEGFDLVDRRSTWVPYEMVSLNWRLPLPPGHGSFTSSSNGLASGNTLLEATSHAICELVERDATALSYASGVPATIIDLATIDDPDCRTALEMYEAAGFEVFVFDITSDVGVPAFSCIVVDPAQGHVVDYRRAGGDGCHLDRNIALLRALTEAAQSRLTMIAGSRDDLARRAYQPGADVGRRLEHEGRTRANGDFRAVETLATDDLRDDVVRLLAMLRKAGLEHVIAFDLSRPDLPFSVVRAIVPGLEGMRTAPNYRPGARAQRAMRSAPA
ncbi:MAG: YcaO-like family protein [Candidatus Eremiobacteraeota bacterium]|nr:YcaO-like family protein [Candidatus Eremiobacteraeota bacterium]